MFQPNQRVKVNRSGLPAAAVSEPLNRSTFPRTPEEVLEPTVETVELEQEQTLEAWPTRTPTRQSRCRWSMTSARSPPAIARVAGS